MASKRRGGGFRPPELRGTLGTLLRTTTGVVRDAIERGAREGRARLDDVRANRRRQDALAELGEVVLDLIRRGEIDLSELPEARDLVRHLDELDAEAPDDVEERPHVRKRFDDRDTDDGTVSSLRSSRPTVPDRPARSKQATTPYVPPASRAPTKPLKVWRPRADEDSMGPDIPAIPKQPLPRDPHRKGGISFDDDDLADYRHPDDVPPKEPPKDED